MPFAIRHHEKYGLYTVRWSGSVTYDEGRAYLKAMAGYDWFEPGLNSLHDFREARLDLSDFEITKLATLYSLTTNVFGPGLSVAIVGDRRGHNLVIAMSAVSARIGRKFLAVNDLPSALNALGLNENLEIEL